MAIKIDLLPEYVPLRRKLRWTISACLVALGGTAGMLALFQHKQQLEYNTAETDLNTFREVADQARKVDAAAKDARTKAGPNQHAVQFIYEAGRTGPQRTALLHQIRQYVYTGAVINEIDLSDGENAVFTAAVRSTDEYAQFLFALRDGSSVNSGVLFADLPGATGLVGYPEGNVAFVPPPPGLTARPLTFPIAVKAKGKLLNPQTVPADPVGDQSGQQGQEGQPANPG